MPGTSANASHTQNGISGVSSVEIRAAWPDGRKREPMKNSVRPMRDLEESEHREDEQVESGDAGDAVSEGNADDTAQDVRDRGRGDHRCVLVPPHHDRHRGDRQRHEAGEGNAEDVGADARLPTMMATPQSATTLASMVRKSRDFAAAIPRRGRRRGMVRLR